MHGEHVVWCGVVALHGEHVVWCGVVWCGCMVSMWCGVVVLHGEHVVQWERKNLELERALKEKHGGPQGISIPQAPPPSTCPIQLPHLLLP